MRKIAARQALILCAVTLIPSLVVAFLHPKRPAWDANALKEGEVLFATVAAWQQPVLWVDARSRKHYEQRHVPDGLLLNEDEWDTLLPALLDAWTPGVQTVVYCDDRQCQASHHVAKRLREAGIDPVYVLKGGWQTWLMAKK